MQVINGVLNICTAIGVFIMLFLVLCGALLSYSVYDAGKQQAKEEYK